jgi:uncharacterized membrane protein YeaQ/YmgE (transglycosylase-associated protein family)
VDRVIGFIVAGLVIGALARLIRPGRQRLSILATLLLGLAGSVIGGIVANALGTGDIFELNVIGFVVAVVAAVVLIAVAEGASTTVRGRR